jgi:hypothetical protein
MTPRLTIPPLNQALQPHKIRNRHKTKKISLVLFYRYIYQKGCLSPCAVNIIAIINFSANKRKERK